MRVGDLFYDQSDKCIMVALVVKNTYSHLMSLVDGTIYVYNKEDWCFLKRLKG